MFALRGITVSLAFFVAVYWLLSLTIVCLWRMLQGRLPRAPRTLAPLLFALRILPLASAAVLTLAFAVPSFLKLEPRSIDEDLGLAPIALGLAALGVLALGMVRVCRAHVQTSYVVAQWLKGASSLDLGARARTFQSAGDIPPLALAGIAKPRIVVSAASVSILSPDELRVAVRHEMAHARSRDNLKKLFFCFAAFPGMAALEHAWAEAVELAADDGAVSNPNDALDLASALVKLSRLASRSVPAFTMSFVPASGLVAVRVQRLLAWSPPPVPTTTTHHWYAFTPVLGALLGIVLLYGPALAFTHQLTEWMVR